MCLISVRLKLYGISKLQLRMCSAIHFKSTQSQLNLIVAKPFLSNVRKQIVVHFIIQCKRTDSS